MTNRLLIVDDEPNLLRAVAGTLRAEGYEVQTARGGAEALARVLELVPDLIVSDIRMPGMSGYALARQLRASPQTDLIPIVFLTAKDETGDRIEGFRVGVDAYLTKPFEPDELVAVISSILSRVRRTHARVAQLVAAAQPNEDDFPPDEALTEAENKVAQAVARGLSNKEIAAELSVSARTVENHISRILAKKRFSNRVEIARHVLARENPG